MSELLSPAGTIEAFYSAISNGADAIYLGLDKFSARAYANNFTLDSLKDLLNFAHLRNVKIFVTINTLIFDKELNDVYKTLDELAKMGVDGIIIQDLAVLHYIKSNYESLPPHASTQMGVDDYDAAKLLKELGFKRIVFARETPLLVIKDIKEKLDIEVEAFIHGALCVSYSGNCYMSSAIGERSGNRGRCAGCCRKYYSLINLDDNKKVKEGYLLSMKDLNVSSKIEDMSFVDSLKIEGRMKEPNYVANVTRIYREILDGNKDNIENLNKVFNRTYTNGFMNGEDSSEITNYEKPNNYGYYIGNVIKANKKFIWIRLQDVINKGDQIRVESPNLKDEISLPILKILDSDFKETNSSPKTIVVPCDKYVNLGAKVYKTKDIKFIEEAERSILKKEYNKLPIDIKVISHINNPLFIEISYQNFNISIKSSVNIDKAISRNTTKENIINQIDKLNDTPYKINSLNIEMDDNCFIPLKLINELRRDAINKLDELRLNREVIRSNKIEIVPQKCELHEPEITVEVSSESQFEIAKSLGIKHIYFKNIIRRNNVKYNEMEGEVLVNGYGGVNHYKSTNIVITDSSLNVTNHISAGILSSLGVNRITLSQEISKANINFLVDKYIEKYHANPNFELIVYGRSKIMHSKYCPLKRLGLCGECKKHHFALQDDFASFPLIFNNDCTTTLLNSKPLNIIDDLSDLKGINFYRLVFTNESDEEMKNILEIFIDKIENQNKILTFKPTTQTKGHFYKNPL